MSTYKDRFLEAKTEVLERCNSSREIYEELDSVVSQYYHECTDDSFEVDDEPYCGPWEIEMLVALLSDLRQYTECVKDDQDIPDDLDYITPFWHKQRQDNDE